MNQLLEHCKRITRCGINNRYSRRIPTPSHKGSSISIHKGIPLICNTPKTLIFVLIQGCHKKSSTKSLLLGGHQVRFCSHDRASLHLIQDEGTEKKLELISGRHQECIMPSQ